jgi:hypothetical protein
MKAEEIIEAPVLYVDRAFKIPPALAVPENPIHERLRTGVHRLEAGGVLLVGGLATLAAGVEIGAPLSVGSLVLVIFGVSKTCFNAGRLQTQASRRM